LTETPNNNSFGWDIGCLPFGRYDVVNEGYRFVKANLVLQTVRDVERIAIKPGLDVLTKTDRKKVNKLPGIHYHPSISCNRHLPSVHCDQIRWDAK
jgi:hypothetical protein